MIKSKSLLLSSTMYDKKNYTTLILKPLPMRLHLLPRNSNFFFFLVCYQTVIIESLRSAPPGNLL